MGPSPTVIEHGPYDTIGMWRKGMTGWKVSVPDKTLVLIYVKILSVD